MQRSHSGMQLVLLLQCKPNSRTLTSQNRAVFATMNINLVCTRTALWLPLGTLPGFLPGTGWLVI